MIEERCVSVNTIYILNVGCSVVVEESGDVNVETGASSDTVVLC